MSERKGICGDRGAVSADVISVVPPHVKTIPKKSVLETRARDRPDDGDGTNEYR